MNKNFTLKLNHMLKKTLVSCTLLGVVVLALASSGGGKSKTKPSLNTSISSNTYTNGFSLKSGPKYTGSLSIKERVSNYTLYNSIVTYQKGNTIYVLPYKYKVTSKLKSNLEVVDLKIRLHK
jgi:hypothetical protein